MLVSIKRQSRAVCSIILHGCCVGSPSNNISSLMNIRAEGCENARTTNAKDSGIGLEYEVKQASLERIGLRTCTSLTCIHRDALNSIYYKNASLKG